MRDKIMYLLVFMLAMCAIISLFMANNKEETLDPVSEKFFEMIKSVDRIPYSDFMDLADKGLVKRVWYNTDTENMIVSYFMGEEDDNPIYVTTRYPGNSDFRKDFLTSGIDVVLVRNKTTTAQTFQSIMLMLLPTLITVLSFVWLISYVNGKGNNLSDTASNKLIQTSDVSFDQIIGIDEIKEHIQLVTNLIKDPSYGKELGIKPSKGILLSGEPGVGKTLIAKAIAHEANVPFISVSGSDFNNIYIGAGAREIRRVFKEAREHKPCIIFIDEIDAIGGNRDNQLATNSERVQTVNAILKEMDGFVTTDGIFIIAATNHPEALDKALKRSGRFDMEIEIPAPRDWKTIEQLFKKYLEDKPLAEDVDLETISRQVVGFTGADVSTVCNEAGIVALSHGHSYIVHEDLEEAIENKVLKGRPSKVKAHEKDDAVVRYHEAGHAVMRYLTNTRIGRISVRNNTSGVGGVVWGCKADEQFQTANQIRNEIMVLFGGRASEEIKFKDVTVGAHNDIVKATQLIKSYIYEFGFYKEAGVLNYEHLADNDNTGTLRCEELSRQLYDETLTMLEGAYHLVERLATKLSEKQTMTGDEVVALLREGE